MKNKLKIGVIFGGASPEYGVSLQSAYSVITNLNPKKYELVLIGINPSGEWYRFLGDIEKIKDDAWCNEKDCIKAVISPNREEHGLLEIKNDLVSLIRLDAVFPVLHGKNGEDGTIQGLLELANIPIVGCKTLSSSLCMDKDKAHKIVSLSGIDIPRSFVLDQTSDMDSILMQAEKLKFPLFVKPVKAGSSFGITKIFDKDELDNAIKLAFKYDDSVIIEENIDGIEIGCAILGNDNLTVGELDEIELSQGFFDYKEKYTLETSAIHVPARISKEKTEEIKNVAKKIYKLLNCTGFARVDMFLTKSGQIYFNEVNTIPGFTTHSRYPNMLKAIGLTFEEVLEKLIELALE